MPGAHAHVASGLGPALLRRVAAVVSGAGAERALARAALLPLAPDARVVPVGLAARTDPRGRRGFAFVVPEGEDLDREPPEVVVVARGPRGLASRLFGSPAEMLAACADRPVLVVRLRPARPYGCVLVASDLSEATADAVRAASRVAPPPADGWLAHVYAPPPHRGGDDGGGEVEAAREAVRARAEASLAALLARLAPAAPALHPQVVAGDPARQLRRLARSTGAELLVVGKSGPAAPGRPLLGSVAEACLRDGEADVLVVPAAGPTVH